MKKDKKIKQEKPNRNGTKNCRENTRTKGKQEIKQYLLEPSQNRENQPAHYNYIDVCYS